MFETAIFLLYLPIDQFASLWNLRRFWDCFLVRRERSLSSVLPWILICASQLMTHYFRQDTPFLLTLFNILSFLLVPLFAYKPAGLKTYFLFAFYCIMQCSVEFMIYSLLLFLKKDYQSSWLSGTISTLILMMLLTHVVSLLSDRKENAPIPNRISFALLLVPAGSLYIMLVQHFTWNNHFLSLTVSCILLLINILTFYIYCMRASKMTFCNT